MSPTTPVEFIGRVYTVLSKVTANGPSMTRWGSSNKHTLVEPNKAEHEAVGGFINDPHFWWAGADVIFDTAPIPLNFMLLNNSYGLKAINETSHWHIQPLDWPAGSVTTPPGWWHAST